MPALCSMLYPTNYAKKYAGIMGAGLAATFDFTTFSPCSYSKGAALFYSADVLV